MAELSKITLPNGNVYDLKDTTARSIGKVSGVKGDSQSSYRTGNVNITATNIGLGNLTNNKQVKGLSSGTTNNNLVAWGSDGYTVADSGIAKGSVATKLALSGTNYSASSNTITVTKANLQSAVQDSSLVLMTADERTKLASIDTGGNYVTVGGTQTVTGAKTFSAPTVVMNSMRIGFVAAGTTVGEDSFTSGYSCSASGRYAHGEGSITHAEGEGSHAEGSFTYAIGYGSHAEGHGTKAYGSYSHSEGDYSEAYGDYSYVSGSYNYATEDYQTVIGKYNSVSIDNSGDEPVYDAGDYAFIIGNGYWNGSTVRSNALTVDWDGNLVCAGGIKAGNNTVASGTNSVATGSYSTASGNYAHAEGSNTKAIGNNSHASGKGTYATRDNQFVIGEYNAITESATNPPICSNALFYGNDVIVDGQDYIVDSGNHAFIIGNGTASNRSNALAIDWNGGIYINNPDLSVNDLQYSSSRNPFALFLGDKDGNRMGGIAYHVNPEDNEMGIVLQGYRKVNNTNYYNDLRLMLDSSGANVVRVSSPSAWRMALQLNNITDMIRVVEFKKTNVSIGANNSVSPVTITATAPTGFSFVSIVGWRIDTVDTTSGANSPSCVVTNYWGTTTLNVTVRNFASSAAKVTVNLKVLYKRTTL